MNKDDDLELRIAIDKLPPASFPWRQQCAKFLHDIGFDVPKDSGALMRGVRGASFNFIRNHSIPLHGAVQKLRKPSDDERAELARWFVMVMSTFVRRTMVRRAFEAANGHCDVMQARADQIAMGRPPEKWQITVGPGDDPDLVLGCMSEAARKFDEKAGGRGDQGVAAG